MAMPSEGKAPASAKPRKKETDKHNSTDSIISLDGDNDSVATRIKEGGGSIKKSVVSYCLIILLGYAIFTGLIIYYNVNGKGAALQLLQHIN